MIKKSIKNLIEYLIVLFILAFLCFYINKNIVMKLLYMDDLLDWSWFRGLNLYEFAFKFYGSTKYRPIFETVQYLLYMIIDTDPKKIITFNEIYNSLVALFIYHTIKRLNAGRIVALVLSSLYIISHFSYYQIGQGIGNLETTSLFFTIFILFYCLKLIGIIKEYDSSGNVIYLNKKNNIKNIIVIFVTYFLIVFTHERFLGLALPIFISIILSKDEDNKVINTHKTITLILFLIEILLICYIRYIAIGNVMPVGTGGTRVEETFELKECIKYCFDQVAFIFGINVGAEHLVGIEFASIPSNSIKILTYISIIIILFVILFYAVLKVKNICNKRAYDINNNFNLDLIFLTFIAMCIGSSSVTIRVEMRFVYVSFTIALIYISYMGTYIKEFFNNKLSKVLITIIIVLICVTRIPVELTYRNYYNKIYCFFEMNRINSIYDETIGKYGLEDILHNKKIYLVKKYYDLTNFYAEYLLKIYDKNNVGSTIILVDDVSEIPMEEYGEDTIILYEDLLNGVYVPL